MVGAIMGDSFPHTLPNVRLPVLYPSSEQYGTPPTDTLPFGKDPALGALSSLRLWNPQLPRCHPRCHPRTASGMPAGIATWMASGRDGIRKSLVKNLRGEFVANNRRARK